MATPDAPAPRRKLPIWRRLRHRLSGVYTTNDARIVLGVPRPSRPWPKHPQWRVLSEDGTAYAVGHWKNGEWHAGSVFRAWRECRSLRRQGEKRAQVVWR